MSFQDVGKSKRNTNTAYTPSSTNTTTTAATSSNQLSFGGFSTTTAAVPRVVLFGESSSSAPSSGNGLSSGGAVSQQLSDGILQYQRNVGILEKIVRQIGSQADGPELESQFQLQVEVLQQLSFRLESLFREEEASFDQMPRTEAARRRATYVKLSRDYQRVQAQAKNFMLEEKSRRSQQQQRNQNQQQQRLTTTTSASLFSTTTTTSSDPEQQIQIQLQIQQDKLAEEMMREREEEIRNINRGMHQVNEIYKDLAHIVGEQQTAIDQIENDMQDARTNAESGLQHVEKANAKFGSGPASQCVIS